MIDRSDIRIKSVEIILSILIIVLILFTIIYFLFFNKKDNTNEKIENNVYEVVKYSKIDENREYYYLIDEKEFELYSGEEYSKLKENFTNQAYTKVSYHYPVININNSKIVEFNNVIKSKVLDAENKIYSGDTIGCIYSKVDANYIRHKNIVEYRYSFNEVNDYLSIIEEKISHCGCLEDDKEIAIYNISKENGEFITNEKILKKYNYKINDLLNKLQEYIDDIELDKISFLPKDNEIEIYLKENKKIVTLTYNGKDLSKIN